MIIRLKTITCTGPDDDTNIKGLIDLCVQDQRVEIALPLCTETTGKQRGYPSLSFIQDFIEAAKDHKNIKGQTIKAALHLTQPMANLFIQNHAQTEAHKI